MLEGKLFKFIKSLNRVSKNDIKNFKQLLSNKRLSFHSNDYSLLEYAVAHAIERDLYDIIKFILEDERTTVDDIYNTFKLRNKCVYNKIIKLLLKDKRINIIKAYELLFSKLLQHNLHCAIIGVNAEKCIKELFKNPDFDPKINDYKVLDNILNNIRHRPDLIRLILTNSGVVEKLSFHFIKKHNLTNILLKNLNLKSEEELENYLKII